MFNTNYHELTTNFSLMIIIWVINGNYMLKEKEIMNKILQDFEQSDQNETENKETNINII